ncbi:hypothetical protein RLIN73S_04779 [Rhodanobacter lindaniclasticus]
MPGALLIGDTAGLLNVRRSRAPTRRSRAACWRPNTWPARLDGAGFDAKLRGSAVMAELEKVRNVKPGFKKGLWFGIFNAGWETVTAGLSPWTLKNKADWSSLHKLGECEEPKRDYVQRTLPARPPGRRLLRGHRTRRRPADPPARGRYRHLRHDMRRGIRQPLHPLLPRQRLRDGGRRQRPRTASACRSTPPTACTARPATSRTRTRSSPGYHGEDGLGRYQNL